MSVCFGLRRLVKVPIGCVCLSLFICTFGFCCLCISCLLFNIVPVYLSEKKGPITHYETNHPLKGKKKQNKTKGGKERKKKNKHNSQNIFLLRQLVLIINQKRRGGRNTSTLQETIKRRKIVSHKGFCQLGTLCFLCKMVLLIIQAMLFFTLH